MLTREENERLTQRGTWNSRRASCYAGIGFRWALPAS